MATHDYSLANQSGASFRTDLNNALAAIQSNNSNSSSPATTVAYQWWADTNTGTLKIRNSANNAWIALLQLDGTLTLENGSNSAPALAFRDQLTTGIFRTSNSLGISSEGTTRALFDSSGLTITNAATISSTGNASLVFDCGTGGAGGNQLSFIDFKINGTVKSNIAVNEGTSGNPLELGSAGNGAVHAFFDNTLKLDTTASGVHISGTLESDNFKASNPGNNALLIQNPSNGIIGFGANNQTNQITISTDGHLGIPSDSGRLRLGASEDLQIYHNGSGNFIDASVGSIAIRTAGNDNQIFMNADGSVEAYFDGTKQFETTSVGNQLKGQTRFATSSGTFCALTEVFKNTSHTAGGSLSFQTVNGHGGGTVTVTLTVNGNAAVKTTKMFGIALRSTSNAGLTSEIFTINSGSGVSFSVSGSSQGVTVANNSSSACTCTVRFDLSGSL